MPGSGPALLLPVQAVVPVAEGDGAGGGLQDGAPAAALLSGDPISIPAAALLWPRHPAAARAEGAGRHRLCITCLENYTRTLTFDIEARRTRRVDKIFVVENFVN